MKIKIALAGNPNTGKTTLFNALTGTNQFVGNWPGVTVEKKEGGLKGHKDVTVVDLPGIYSLSPYTLEEVVARNYLIQERPDAILNIMMNVCDGLVVYEKVIRARVMNELPFMATENIMMDAVKRGGDRQQLHEKLRVHSQAAARVVKEGGRNDLIDRIAADPAFMVTREEIEAILDPANFTGRSQEQVEEFLRDVIRPVLEANRALLGEKQELSV